MIILISALFNLFHMVAFVPTARRVSDAMVRMAALKPGELVVDLGAGDGRILEVALSKQPKIRAIGYEGSFGVWLLAQIRHLFTRHKPPVLLRNFLKEDLSKVDVVFTYLSMNMMTKLKPKFEKELKKGARVVAHAFKIPDRKHDASTSVPMQLGGTTGVYVYRY